MTAILACWVGFPLLLGLLAQGAGTVLERLHGGTLALGVRLPCAVALIIAVMDFATRLESTARLAVPAALALGALGLILSPPWRWRRLEPGLLAAGIVFAVYAAPVVLSGMATWTGYIKLDDTATWLALVDRALTHGRTLAGLAPSTYRAVLSSYLTAGYPLGSFLPLGIGHAVLGQDIAWLVNPWMAFLAATLAMALEHIAARCLGRSDRAGTSPSSAGGPEQPHLERGQAQPPALGAWQPVAIAALAAQPALLYGYYLWAGIKEVAGAMLIAAFAVTAPAALAGKHRLRAAIPVAVVLWALVAALSPGGLVWVGPGLAATLALWALAGALRRRARPSDSGEPGQADMPGAGSAGPLRWGALASVRTVALVAGVAVVGVYLVVRPGGFVERFKGVLTANGELGNLVKPLSVEQVAGIWPTGDFRFAPSALTVTDVLVAVAILSAVAGLVLALRADRRELVLYVLCALAGAAVVDGVAAPWLGAKALASASPAIPLAALSGLAMIAARRDLRLAAPVGALAGAAIAAGIVWSNLLAYHDVSLAPRAQFAELAQIGERIAGEGPTLMTEYQPYGVRHFLREASPEAPAELRMREDPLISGELLEKGESVDIDQLALPAVLVYRTLVIQRSPVASRPPSPYRLRFVDRFWEVWQRPARLQRPVIWHLPLGDPTHPGSVPDCTTLIRLSRHPGVSRLVAAPVENPQVISLAGSSHPAAWSSGGPELAPNGAGTAHLRVNVSQSGHYSVWLGGSTKGPLSIYVDGRLVGAALQQIQEPGQYIPFGELDLDRGEHSVSLRYGGGDWRPGTGGPPEAIGPLVLARQLPAGAQAPAGRPLITLAPSQARSLCARTLDWVEGLGA